MTSQESANLTFLALTVWREARGEPFHGKLGVAFSIMNRVKRPAWWGNDLQGVVFKRWQYSSMTDPKDPQVTKWPLSGDPAWQECLEVAEMAILGAIPSPVDGADSYFDLSIPAPKWANEENFVCAIGRLRFHDVDKDHESVPA